jgi:predicted MFS family arabinose efflux permease
MAAAILFLSVLLNLLDRQVLNVVAQDIKVEFRLTDAGLGLLTGATFGLLYAVVGIPVARLADRVDRRKLIAGMLLAWSLSKILCGVASGYVMLAIARTGVGLGEAGAQPASTALIYDLARPDKRGTALSLMLLGVPLGLLLAYAFGGAAADAWGWRAALLGAGAPGVLLSCLVFVCVRDPRPREARPASRAEPSFLSTLGTVLRRPAMGWLMVGLSASSFVAYVTNAWIAAYFIRFHGLSLDKVGLFAALSIGIGGGLGTLGAGPLCDRLRRRIRQPEAWILALSIVLCIPALLLMVFATRPGVALVAMVMFQTTAFAWLAPLARLIQEAAGPSRRSLAIACCSSAGAVFTLCIGVPGVGLVSDLLAPVVGARSIGYALAITGVPVALLGATAYRCALKRLEMPARAKGSVAA